MSSRVALVTCSPSSPGVHRDGELVFLLQVLNSMGIQASSPIWTEHQDWGQYDLLVLKSPWDYSMRTEEFRKWLSRVEKEVQVRNHPRLVRWNYDKRYLIDLQAAGLPVPSFTIACTKKEAYLALETFAGKELVIKPTVSAGARNTGLFHPSDPSALHLVDAILALDKSVLVQQAVPSVSKDGEHALVLFNGDFSHAVRKGPILNLGGGFRGGVYSEKITPASAPADEIELAQRCMEAISEVSTELGVPGAASPPLYARIDVVRDENNTPTILEVELFEPSYFTLHSEGSAIRFGKAIEAQLRRIT